MDFLLFIIFLIGSFIVAAIFYSITKYNDWRARQRKISDSDAVYSKKKKKYVVPLEIIVDSSSESLSFKVKVLEIRLDKQAVRYDVDHSCDPHYDHEIDENRDEESSWAIKQVSSVAKKLVVEIRPQNQDLQVKFNELERLKKLASSSDLYTLQANLYRRAKEQVAILLESGRTLDRECDKFVRETLIGEELMKYNPENIPDIAATKISLDYQCDQISSEYQKLKSEIQAYNSLKS
jgi:hypothetical protein